MQQHKPVFIPLLLGTVRQGRRSEAVARWLIERIEQRTDISTQLLDPRDMYMPMDDDGESLKEQNPEYTQAIEKSDGLLIVSPEYNHSYPGTLKRAIDMLDPEYARRAVGLVGVSKGNFGGVRMLEHLHALVHAVGLIESKTDLMVPNAIDLVDDAGVFHAHEQFIERADAFLDELVWLAQALRWGREENL